MGEMLSDVAAIDGRSLIVGKTLKGHHVVVDIDRRLCRYIDIAETWRMPSPTTQMEIPREVLYPGQDDRSRFRRRQRRSTK